jgi:hypothetical protein
MLLPSIKIERRLGRNTIIRIALMDRKIMLENEGKLRSIKNKKGIKPSKLNDV